MKKSIYTQLPSMIAILGLIGILTSCTPGGSGGLNLFSVTDDIAFGKQAQQEIANNPQQYPILDRSKYPVAYRYLDNMKNQILNSGAVNFKEQFAWELYIIHDDQTLNAFVTPGGYIYVYTGLMKYLDSEDQLAGVLGHEVAHADRRHSTRNLTKQYGLSVLLTALSGNNSNQLTQMVAGLAGNVVGLKFNRETEKEADDFSVIYLSKTQYQCNGAAGFFEKIMSQGNGQEPPQFLSTHPSSANRVQDINAKAQAIGCPTKPSNSNYQALLNSLP